MVSFIRNRETDSFISVSQVTKVRVEEVGARAAVVVETLNSLPFYYEVCDSREDARASANSLVTNIGLCV